MRPARALWCGLALALGCSRFRPGPRTAPVDALAHHPDTDASAPDAPAEVLTQTADVPAVPSSLDAVVDAVRRRAWAEAAGLLGRLPPDAQTTREARYIAARVKIENGDFSGALTVLQGLDAELPALRLDVLRLAARCLARTRQHAASRALYERLAREGGGERDRAHAAVEAFEAGDAAAAAVVMRAWPEHAPPGLDAASAWRYAGLCLEAVHDVRGAASAWRAVVLREPDAGHATEALAALQRLGVSLSPEQLQARAAELIERARYTEALAILEPMAPGAGRYEGRRLHLLGRAYYGARNRYNDAHRLLLQASLHASNDDRAEDAFLAARSLARADRDDESVRAFDEVARTDRGRWGDEAAYRAAWLEVHHHHPASAIARLRAFLRDRPDASSRLKIEASWQLGWMLFTERRYDEAVGPLEQSGALATHHLERGRGRYWAALARERSGHHPEAAAGFRALIVHRPLTWYAMLAETRLRETGEAVTAAAPLPEARPCPAVVLPPRVRWFAALGFDDDAAAAFDADDERLRATLPPGRADETMARAWLSLGDARRAFLLSSRHADDLDSVPTAETRWVWEMGFPRPHAAWVEAAEDEARLPRHYLYAIMRQESGFNRRDVSSARAMGLLQMIPPTTRRVAQSLSIAFREEMLFEPDYNIRVGGWYIGRLYAQYHGVLPRAIGAYNAGPGAMGRWVREFGAEPLDVFVERIPYDETRTYVRRVVQNLARYQALYGPRVGESPVRISLSTEGAGVDALVDY